MRFSRFRRAGALLLALVLACSLLTLPAAAEDVALVRIELNKDELTLEKGTTEELTVSFAPADATNKKVTWESSNTSVATVTNGTAADKGVVTAKGAGTATITVKSEDGGLTDTCEVTVTETIHATHITLRNNRLELTAGETVSLPEFIMSPANANDEVEWSVADENVAAIEDGELVAKKQGRTTITVSSKADQTVNDTCTVDVSAILELSDEAIDIATGGTGTLTAILKGSDDHFLEWQSSSGKFTVTPKETTAADGENHVVQIKLSPNAAVGDQTTISATSRSNPKLYRLCVVTVVAPRAPSVNSVSITSPANDDRFRYLDPDETISLTAMAYPVDAPATNRRILWSSSNETVAVVNTAAEDLITPSTGIISGLYPGEATITAAAAGDSTMRDSRDIEVSGILLSYTQKSATGGQGTRVELTEGKMVELYQNQDIAVMTNTYGNAKLKTVNWSSSNNSVANVIAGRVTAAFPGEAVITAEVAGTSYRASFSVRVTEDSASAITVSMGSDPSYSFSKLLSSLNDRSRSKAGDTLQSVYNLTVPTASGTLYYRYSTSSSPGHGVGGSERFYYNPANQDQKSLRDVTFVPAPGFSGAAVVEYNAQAVNGSTFNGTIRIEVSATGGVAYSTEAGGPVTFAAEHFSSVCQSRTGQAVSYVNFSQPPSSQGVLYQDYSRDGLYAPRVIPSTRYYVSSKPSINQVTFVPAEGFSGTSSVTYRCISGNGQTFTGVITITVGDSGKDSGSSSQGSNVEYSIAMDERLDLYAGDFNRACQRAVGGTLNYIRFRSLPSSSTGTMYQEYHTNDSTRAVTDRRYYQSAYPRISNLTFVPASRYNGTVSIPYTGVNTSGTSYTGNLIIRVGTASSRTVDYSTTTNSFVRFNSSTFNNICRSVTGETLNYIRFDSGTTSYGTLYYQYNSSTRVGTSVGSGTSYYYSGSGRRIDELSFASNSTAGTVRLGFTGYSTQGTSFSGTVQIQITSSSAAAPGINNDFTSSSIHYTGCSGPVSFRSSDFQSACQTTLGHPLSSVQFNTLPGSGHLYLNYNNPGQRGTSVGSASPYGIQELDRISYLPKADVQGLITIPYTAFDTQGSSYSGMVEIQLSNSYLSNSFTDVYGSWSWAQASIEFLRQSGITNGYSDNTFRPGQPISRGEFTLMICRAFQFPTTGDSGFPDVPAGSVYAGAVASARDRGIVQGNNGLFQPGLPITRQSAITMICRAMAAAGQPVPEAPASLLSTYADGAQIGAHARSSVASLIQMGVVRGTSGQRLNPGEAISRAEMAVLLHRVLTQ